MNTNKLFFILAAIVFALATLGVPTDRFQAVPLGLFFLTLGLVL